MRLPRAAAAIALAAGLALGTTGCTFLTPIATQNPYDQSDGVNVRVGDIAVRNALALLSEDGSVASLLITLVNTASSESVDVNLQFESDGEKTTITESVRGGEALQFGNTPDQDQIIILEPAVGAGELLPVYVQYGDQPGRNVMVPVLEAAQSEYQDLRPEKPSPTPTSTPAPTAPPTPTPTPTP